MSKTLGPTTRRRKKTNCLEYVLNSHRCKYYDKQVILVLIASSFILSSSSSVGQVFADSETVKLVDNDYRSNSTMDTNPSNPLSENKTTVNGAMIKESPRNQTQISAFGSIGEHKHHTLDLINDDTYAHRFWTVANQSNRHAYNVSYEKNSPAMEAYLLPQSDGSSIGSNTSQVDDLSASDSKFVPKSASSRFDEDVEVVDDDVYSSDEPSYEPTPGSSSNSYDGSSSNLSEQKIVKEITKIISKGMSSATDQVGLDTLESWKRRQRKRKAVKDNRAKVFEDILNAAIVSHSERPKKKTSRKSNGSKGEASAKQSSFAQSTSGLSNNPNIDPDIAFDAENVISHLQGISNLIDGGQGSSLAGLGYNSGGTGNEDSSHSHEEATSAGNEEANEYSEATDAGSSDETLSKPKKTSSTNDRPLVRRLKKIKKQISQRRKQLDQVKKLFNNDSTSSQKDASSNGKSTSSPPKRIKDSESSSDEEETTSVDSKKKNNSAKMHDLIQYLRKNPEILASVMSELTVDADPTNDRPSPMIGANEDSSNHYQSLNMGSIDAASGPSRVYHSGSMDTVENSSRTDPLPVRQPQYRKPFVAKVQQPQVTKQVTAVNQRPHYRANSAMDTIDEPLVKPLASLNKAKSAEALVLASLRERQLMNLARLETVLAERQAASDRSQVYSSLLQKNQPGVGGREDPGSSALPKGTVSDFAQPSTTLPSIQQSRAQSSEKSIAPSRDKSAQDKDDEHHFLVTNQNTQPIDHQLIRHSTNETITSPPFQITSNNAPANYQYPFTADHKQLYDQQQNQNAYQQQQQLHAYYQPTGPSEPRIPSLDQQNNLDSNSRQQYSTRPHNQQQNPSSSLSRFRNWRDVSQSETGLLQRSNYMNPTNITWSPYDMTPGSILNGPELKRPLNNLYRAQSSNQRIQSVPNEHSAGYPGKSRYRGQVDSVVTRPGNRGRDRFLQEQSSDSSESDSSSATSRFDLPENDQASFASSPESKNESDSTYESDQNDPGDDMVQHSHTSIGRQPTHVDYFSSYKRDWEDNKSRRKRRNNPIEGHGDINDINHGADQNGAIWA